LIYESAKPLTSMERRLQFSGPWRYHLLYRQSTTGFVLVGSPSEVVTHIRSIVSQKFTTLTTIRSMRVEVHALVSLLQDTGDQPSVAETRDEADESALNEQPWLRREWWRLGQVYANVPAYGEALRSVAFFGDDIASADLFLREFHVLGCYQAAMRAAQGSTEALRISVDGAMSFRISRGYRADLELVDRALQFVGHHGFITRSE
jgi:hypothetical protein